MKINKKFNSVALVLAALILYLISISFAATEQSTMPAGTYAYIPNDGHISVIDTANNNVTATVHVEYPRAVAVMPDGTKVYVTSGLVPENNVSVINTSTNTVIATVPVGADPCGIAITPDGKKAYVTNYGTGSLVLVGYDLSKSTGVFVIDTATNTVIAIVQVEGNPVGVAITPDGKKAYVTACFSNNNVSVIDTATNTVTATVPVGDNPKGVAVTPDGTKAYVTNQGSNNVSVIDTTTNTVMSTVPVGPGPEGIAITPDGTKVYVTNSDNGDYYINNSYINNSNKSTVSVIDTAQNNVIANIYVGGSPSGIAVTPDGKKVFVTNTNDNNVSVISTKTNNVIAKIKVGISGDLGQFIGSIPAQTDRPITNFSTKISNSNGSNINTNLTVNALQSRNNTSNLEKTSEQTQKLNASNTGREKTPGFDFVQEVVSLISLGLYKRKIIK